MLDNQVYITGSGLIILFLLVFKASKDNNDNVKGIYKRLDSVKSDTANTYTRKDICEVVHKQVSSDLTEIKSDVKKLLSKNGIK